MNHEDKTYLTTANLALAALGRKFSIHVSISEIRICFYEFSFGTISRLSHLHSTTELIHESTQIYKHNL